MIKKLTFTLILSFFLIKPAFATEEGDYLINQIQQEYQKIESFSCTGEIQETYLVNDVVTNERVINFTIKMKKPDLFLVYWKMIGVEDHPVLMEGAIWSEEGKYFFYEKNLELYFEISEPEQAFSFATGLSQGIAYKIPSLFFESFFRKNWLDSFEEPSLHKCNGNIMKFAGVVMDSDSIEEYEIESIKDQNLIKNHWSKITQLGPNKKNVEAIKILRKSIEENKKIYEEMIAEIDDSEEIEITESYLRLLDEQIERLSNLPENEDVKHYVVNETFENISTSNLKQEDFKFHVPPGVEFKGKKLGQLLDKLK